MKTKEEILKMSKEELENYKWNDDLNKKDKNIYCSDCFNCSDCYLCRHLKSGKFCICNIQLTEAEYKKKMKEMEK